MDTVGKADTSLFACRFPSFIGVPIDIDEPQGAKIPGAGAKPNLAAE